MLKTACEARIAQTDFCFGNYKARAWKLTQPKKKPYVTKIRILETRELRSRNSDKQNQTKTPSNQRQLTQGEKIKM